MKATAGRTVAAGERGKPQGLEARVNRDSGAKNPPMQGDGRKQGFFNEFQSTRALRHDSRNMRAFAISSMKIP
jgi:hypothetical protein